MAPSLFAAEGVEIVSQLPKILLLVNNPPWGAESGQHYLGALARHIPSGALCRYSTVQEAIPAGHRDWLGFPSAATRIRMPALPVFSTLAYAAFARNGVEKLLRSLLEYAKQEKVEKIWAVVTSPVTYLLAHRAAAALQIPMVCTVLDPPEYLIGNLRMDPDTGRAVSEEFAACVRASERVAVVSHGMAAEYSRRFDAKCIVMPAGIHPSLWMPERPRKSNPEELVIGFAGGLYAKREWQALLGSIQSVGGTLGGRRIKIRFVGRWPLRGVSRPGCVAYHAPVSQSEAIRLMSETDVCYLPYWFDSRHETTVRLSFPSKLSSYVAAGRPILYHGPAESSPAYFLSKHPVGVCCHSNEHKALLEAMERCIEDEAFLAGYCQARAKALDEELGAEAMLRSFARLLGAERSELAPLCAAG